MHWPSVKTLGYLLRLRYRHSLYKSENIYLINIFFFSVIDLRTSITDYLKVIHPSLNHFYNPLEAHWNFMVDASIKWPWCMLKVTKRWHLLWNFNERLEDCDRGLMMEWLPYLFTFSEGVTWRHKWHHPTFREILQNSLMDIPSRDCIFFWKFQPL